MDPETVRALVWESVQAAIERCPLCNGTISPDDMDIATRGYGCDTGCMVAALDLSHACGWEYESYRFGEWDEFDTAQEVQEYAEDLLKDVANH